MSVNIKIQDLNYLVPQSFFINQVNSLFISPRRIENGHEPFLIRWLIMRFTLVYFRVASRVRHSIGEQRQTQ
jgi:hypothetical protein